MAHVLVVDDESSIRLTLREFLKADGHDVEVAETAEKAMEVLRSGDFDVVLSDVVMPRVSGVQLLKEIRSTAPNVQVIMMTGEPTVETASEAVRADAIDYLIKPVGKSAVLRSVGNAAKIKAVDDERRRLEKLEREHKRELERLVAERTRELSSALEDLERAQEQVIEQERLAALAQMVSGIAHDFNNVLMPILGFADLLRGSPAIWADRAEVQRLLDMICEAAEDGRSIVLRLREFYKPNTALQVKRLDLRSLVERVIELTKPVWKAQTEAEGRRVEVIFSASELPPVEANEAQLREVLTNLIFNAIQAIPDEGTVSIECESAGDTATIRVRDTGKGMSPDVLKRCKEPFFSTKGDHGTGLGLSMCHGIIQRHGGVLDIASAPGRGTTVSVQIPIRSEHSREQAEEIPDLPEGRALHILSIDDEEWSRVLLVKLLSADGHTVVSAQSPAQGLEQLSREKFDLVITDRAMPGMSGDEVARRVKATCPGVPVILLTGFGDLMTGKGECPVGVDEVIGKPVTRSDLHNAVARTMAGAAFALGRPLATLLDQKGPG